jgi:hypothetical protein
LTASSASAYQCWFGRLETMTRDLYRKQPNPDPKSRTVTVGACLRIFSSERLQGIKIFLTCASLCIMLLPVPSFAATCHGRVVDAKSGRPIAGALATMGNTVVQTGPTGAFRVAGPGSTAGVRADGYLRTKIPVSSCNGSQAVVRLKPFRPKALYLSFYAIGTPSIRNKAVQLIHKTELNALVIDVKGDRGMIAYPSAIPLAKEDGAQNIITIPNLKARVEELHKSHLYLIARVVSFKDDELASARPDLAVKTKDGKV